MSKKPVTSRRGRFLKLAGMTASVAGQYAGQRARRLVGRESEEQRSKQYARMADEIVDTLGELKGAVMKVGQVASQTQDFLPREFSEALQRLQKEAPPMPFEIIRQQVEAELGAPVDALFADLQERPYAAASIGQVHRATLKDGREVIVKVQYPGVDESCDSDLRQLRMTLKFGGLLRMPRESADRLFEEIRVRLKEELDYNNEASNIRRFRAYHEKHPWVRIPEVIDSHSTRHVLTMGLEEGDHLQQVANDPDRYDQATINLLGERLFITMADELFDFQCIHGDPHAGNFAFRPDGIIVLYDFGCVKSLRPSVVASYRQALIATLEEDYEALDRHLIDLGARVATKPPIHADYYAMWRNLLIPPFAGETPYDFGASDIHRQIAAHTHTVFRYLDRLQPAVESMFIDRMVAGHYWILKQMGVQAALGPLLEHYLKDDETGSE
ncbi:Predicted unusual protein kinase regulating ubiquinone biosynthesis, AarF/ABC1/UbiB family [Marinobacter daqiaonensis]|uniref:Predicted unusual protein kinase regulating ubiquinone biosynthesis, AarF/ABC1/UbiB family n=1 Tax=Marinobacter daqiaonensis TaxID=650891 RepID=A0A1I6HEN7_9GAMM|nr:AarF/ABC1/UbiB kinase family protein [Marinobacter daqiaonensis]SFR52841.1 Predicted unusual protein kinase regulating ubiquinone biosynthesis, AarF/ABC1/UbiB family [Marinobacter daqiaonensis]